MIDVLCPPLTLQLKILCSLFNNASCRLIYVSGMASIPEIDLLKNHRSRLKPIFYSVYTVYRPRPEIRRRTIYNHPLMHNAMLYDLHMELKNKITFQL